MKKKNKQRIEALEDQVKILRDELLFSRLVAQHKKVIAIRSIKGGNKEYVVMRYSTILNGTRIICLDSIEELQSYIQGKGW